MRKKIYSVAIISATLNFGLVLSSCKKECTSKKSEAGSVRVIYIIPSNKTFSQKYADSLRSCALELKSWYENQVGKTFKLNQDIIEIVYSDKPSAWFGEYHGYDISGTGERFYFFYNTYYWLKKNIDCYNTELYKYEVYVDAFGEGAGGMGVSAMGINDIVGLSNPFRGRWLGGSAHEWGHSFGLDHPAASSDDDIMSLGYLYYPNAFLNNGDKSRLSNNSFFK